MNSNSNRNRTRTRQPRRNIPEDHASRPTRSVAHAAATARSAVILAACAALLALGCPGQGPPAESPPLPIAKKTSEPVVWRQSKSGLGFRLSDASPEAEARPQAVRSTMLSDADAHKLLARLPPLETQPDDTKSFALRDKSRPAPRAGKTVEQPFPPPDSGRPPPSTTSRGPLRVTRHVPEGRVDVVPSLNVSFSAPMIAVTSHDDLGKSHPPVSLVPEPPGKWRWLGSQTVVFDPELRRFPKSTDYRVEVKSGTQATDGSALARPEVWTFSTPTVTLARHAPSGSSIELEPAMFAAFDQGIDPQAILATMKVLAGAAPVRVVPLSKDDVEASPQLRELVKGHESKPGEPPRYLAFKPARPLPKATHVTIQFPEGTPSAEGPKKTTRSQAFDFSTYGPLALRTSRCGWGACPPLAPFQLEFTNNIDASSFEASMVSVSPALDGMKVEVSGSTIVVRGRSKGKAKYTVTVAGGLKDQFGQTLGAEAKASFDVNRAQPALFVEEQPQIVLDPESKGKLSVFSINRDALRVQLYQVKPEDWSKYIKWRRDWDYDGKDTTPPGRLVQNTIVRPTGDPDTLVETAVALSPALTNGFGQVLAIVEPVTPAKRDRRNRERLRQWLQVTNLGLDVFTDQEQLFAWASSLSTGAPEAGVDLSLLPTVDSSSRSAFGLVKTGVDGTVRADLSPQHAAMVVARKGSDLVMLSDRYDADLGLGRSGRYEHMRWFTFDDRRMYKPGEEVHVKGWIREAQSGREGDLAKLKDAGTLTWTAMDPRGSKLADGKTSIDATGGFDFALKLPKDANLGTAHVELSVGSHSGRHTFEVQEFRRPEFEVGVSVSEGPHLVGRHAVATVSAKYFAGGGLPAAEAKWQVRRSDAQFTPPNLTSFSFGKGPESWWWGRRQKLANRSGGGDEETWSARTSAAGEHALRIDFDAVEPPYPMSLALEASVTDVNRQEWTARSTVLVHPADVTAGLRTQRAYVRAGESIPVEAVVSDLDGTLVAGSTIRIKSARIDSQWTPDGYKDVQIEPQSCDLTSGKEPARCLLPTKRGGLHEVTALVSDVFGRKSQTRITLWVAGDDDRPGRELSKDVLQILPDKTSYAPGDTAELLVMAPFAPAEAVLTVRRQGIVHFERLTLAKTSQVVRVRLDRTHFPSVMVRVDAVGAAPRDNLAGEPDPRLPKRPAHASGVVTLQVPPKERTLEITARPKEAKVDPGSTSVIDVDVKAANGRPAPGATVALAVVDESILALTGAKLPDPIAAFYAPRGDGSHQYQIRDLVWLARPRLDAIAAEEAPGYDKKTEGRGAYKNGAGKSGAARMEMAKPAASISRDMSAAPGTPPSEDALSQDEATPLKLRKDFAALAAWMPKVVMDQAGHATVSLKLPESLTRYRIIAVGAAEENWFGAGESTVTARLPLMVRPSATRFLNFGDRLDFPIVLQNQTDSPLDVMVAARASNAKMLDSGGRRVVVPANDRVEVRVPVAAEKPGTARFQVAAASGNKGDASELSLPVWTPATTEAFATYGTIDEGAISQPVHMPTGVVKEFGGIEITTSSTGLQGLTDAVLYLLRYPFDCNEQISSRMIAIAALRDVLGAFNAAGMPSEAKIAETMKLDMEKLKTRQHYSGGFSFWGPNYQPNPWVSIHAAHAIERAKGKGYKPPSDLESRVRSFLAGVEQWIPSYYLPEHRRATIAYALYVRHRFGDKDVARAKKLIVEAGGVEKLPLETLGWLLPILGPDGTSATEAQAMRRMIANRVTETAGAAHFATSYGDGEYVLLHSDRRADGVLLEALIGDQKDSDLIPKLVTGLLGHRKAGRWSSTQENAFILLALDRYFQTYEKTTPNFVGRAWLGEKLAMEQTFQGRSTDRQHVKIPLSLLAELAQPQNLVVQKDGVGRLYYRIGMQYAPSDLRPPPAEQGFTVSRVYESVDDPKDVRRDPDGTYRVKAGTKVRVRVSMVAPSRRHHVALVDPLPAGLEPMNPALAVTGAIPPDPKAEPKGGVPWWWSRTWYEHQNMRDERVEAFTSLLWDGVYEYTYVALATTPGVFVAPPPKAEEMYSPETFGRGAGDRMIVE